MIKAAHISQGKRLTAEVGLVTPLPRVPLYPHNQHSPRTHARLQERDKRLMHLTHVVTGQRELGARGVLEGLRVLSPAQGQEEQEQQASTTLTIVGPAWLQACLQHQRLVETAAYELPFEPAPAMAAAPSDSSAAAGGKKRPRSLSPPAASASPAGSPAKGKQVYAPPPRTRAEIEAILDRDFPALDTETREAYVAWGGPLEIKTGKDMPPFACQRPAPRQHPNGRLTGVFEELQDFYNATGDKERETSFGRALGVLRAWPRRIESSAELKGARHIGAVRLQHAGWRIAVCGNGPFHDLTNRFVIHHIPEHVEGGGSDPRQRHHGPA